MNAFWTSVSLIIGLGIIARLLIVNAGKREESVAEKRIRRQLAKELGKSEVEEIEQAKGLFGRPKRPKGEHPDSVKRLATWFAGAEFFRQEEGKNFIEKLRENLVLAGQEQKYTPYEAIALVVIIWAFGVVGTTAVYLLGAIPKMVYLGAVIIALIYPMSKLRSLKRSRMNKIRAENIIFITQLSTALSSGMTTLDEALARIARQAEIDPYDSVLASEFGRAINRVRVGGADWDEAMREVSARTGVLSVENLVEALIQGRKMGSDLTETLDEYGSSAAELWQQDMRTIKAKKEPLITIGMVITMFGGFFLIAGPMLLTMMRTMSILGG